MLFLEHNHLEAHNVHLSLTDDFDYLVKVLLNFSTL